MEDLVISAEARTTQGKGASRRLRHAGKVPAIIYGGKGQPANLQLDADELANHLKDEAFFSSILVVNGPEGKDNVVLKDVQRHPHKAQIMHVDFQRVVAGQEIRMNVPLHFINGETAPATVFGGMIEHMLVELDILVLPKHLPEYIEVDLAELAIGETIYLSDITLPEGVRMAAADYEDSALAVAHKPRTEAEDNLDDPVEGDADGDEEEDSAEE